MIKLTRDDTTYNIELDFSAKLALVDPPNETISDEAHALMEDMRGKYFSGDYGKIAHMADELGGEVTIDPTTEDYPEDAIF